tara:strand:- start:131 stop:421 length:291 start_codon:yes stop_codon:yes gene_type:complete
MYWFIYIIFSIFLALLLVGIRNKFYPELVLILLVIFVTPTNIELSGFDYAPSLFTFSFNLLLQQELSTRALRPILLTVPISLGVLFLYRVIKKRFF